jgi:hypothetical protein
LIHLGGVFAIEIYLRSDRVRRSPRCLPCLLPPRALVANNNKSPPSPPHGERLSSICHQNRENIHFTHIQHLEYYYYIHISTQAIAHILVISNLHCAIDCPLIWKEHEKYPQDYPRVVGSRLFGIFGTRRRSTQSKLGTLVDRRLIITTIYNLRVDQHSVQNRLSNSYSNRIIKSDETL